MEFNNNEKRYSKNETMLILQISQELSGILIEEDMLEVNIYDLAVICMGIYETYKEEKEKGKLSQEEINNISVFFYNNEEQIKYSALKLIEKFREQDNIEEQVNKGKIFYN